MKPRNQQARQVFKISKTTIIENQQTFTKKNENRNQHRNQKTIKTRNQQTIQAWNSASNEINTQSKRKDQLAMETKKQAICCNQNYALH